MRILIDTHILLWWLEGNPRLAERGRKEIDSENNEIYVSCVSLWEIAIKTALGKLKMPNGLPEILKKNAIAIVPVLPHHVASFSSVPVLHGDPFDRMLIAQTLAEDLTLMTHDRQISAYAISCLLV